MAFALAAHLRRYGEMKGRHCSAGDEILSSFHNATADTKQKIIVVIISSPTPYSIGHNVDSWCPSLELLVGFRLCLCLRLRTENQKKTKEIQGNNLRYTFPPNNALVALVMMIEFDGEGNAEMNCQKPSSTAIFMDASQPSLRTPSCRRRSAVPLRPKGQKNVDQHQVKEALSASSYYFFDVIIRATRLLRIPLSYATHGIFPNVLPSFGIKVGVVHPVGISAQPTESRLPPPYAIPKLDVRANFGWIGWRIWTFPRNTEGRIRNS
ncbi:hypothetical protein BD769DRAFT_1670959 [Suillus cothurnatus]|nr:hypothetical protein BD769DRAFT_1670959 [Suillus cothurnatus]